MRPPNTYDKDYHTALRMAEEAEKRASWYPVRGPLHAIRDQWLELACHLESTPTHRSGGES